MLPEVTHLGVGVGLSSSSAEPALAQEAFTPTMGSTNNPVAEGESPTGPGVSIELEFHDAHESFDKAP